MKYSKVRKRKGKILRQSGKFPKNLGDVGLVLEQMPVLSNLRSRFANSRPMEGARVAIVFHLTKEAAALAMTISAAGAETTFIPSKTATADHSVVEVLGESGVRVLIAESEEHRLNLVRDMLNFQPHLMIDNADLFNLWHSEEASAEGRPKVIGASVHSRSACSIVEEHIAAGKGLRFPIIAVGSSPIKLELESYYGTGQSVLAALIQVTRLQLNGKKIAIVGFGNVGSGLAHFARGIRARVTIVQNSAYRALKAVMDGYDVRPLEDAIKDADIVVTATGTQDVIGEDQLRLLQDGTFLGNIGRGQEIDVQMLRKIAQSNHKIDNNIEKFVVDGKCICLMGDGHQFNHMVGSANAPEIMDISLALHAYGLEELWLNRDQDRPKVATPISRDIANAVAETKLDQLGFKCV